MHTYIYIHNNIIHTFPYSNKTLAVISFMVLYTWKYGNVTLIFKKSDASNEWNNTGLFYLKISQAREFNV